MTRRRSAHASSSAITRAETMEIRWIKADPTGNITALVESPAAPSEAVAAAVFAADESVEQLGFLSNCSGADIALSMAGGEFCGNACLCAAAYHLGRSGLKKASLRVAISGAEEPVAVDMRRIGENEYTGFVDMPLPLSVENLRGLPLVRFAGISHIILPWTTPTSQAEAMIAQLCAELDAEALGLMLFDPVLMRLRPLVYVPAAGTLCWESSCASGSCAVAASLAHERGENVSLSLSQPGGTLLAEAAKGRLRLGGSVRLGEAKSLKSENFEKIPYFI